MNQQQIREEGALFLIDKDLHWTSFDVVKKVRNLIKVKKVGHAGTLDPLATGLLIVCAGRMTKQINRFQEQQKEYTGTFELGKTTASFDLETPIEQVRSIDHLTEYDLMKTEEAFTGRYEQEPPAYSAVKVQGKRAYDIARTGVSPEIRKKFVEAHKLVFTSIEWPDVHFKLTCSKGFYVRSLVRDIGDYLSVGACLKTLRRTRIGDYTVDEARDMKAFEQYIQIAMA